MISLKQLIHHQHALQGVISEHQQVVLEYRMDQTVATADEPPQIVGRLPPAFVERLGPSLRSHLFKSQGAQPCMLFGCV